MCVHCEDIGDTESHNLVDINISFFSFPYSLLPFPILRPTAHTPKFSPNVSDKRRLWFNYAVWSSRVVKCQCPLPTHRRHSRLVSWWFISVDLDPAATSTRPYGRSPLIAQLQKLLTPIPQPLRISRPFLLSSTDFPAVHTRLNINQPKQTFQPWTKILFGFVSGNAF